MKTLIILAIILGIFAAYFVFNSEKSISVKSTDDVVPVGTDIAKFILNKALNQAREINPAGIIDGVSALRPGLAEKIKSKIGEVGNEISVRAFNLIKRPIENKARELICPLN